MIGPRLRPWLPLVALLAVLLWGPRVTSPDGVEMAAAGRCLFLLPLRPDACVGLELTLWPPVFPLVSGIAALLVGVDLAPRLVSAAGFVLLAAVLGRLARRVAGERGGLAAIALLLAVPALQVPALAGEARALALAALLAAHDQLWPRDAGRGPGARAGVLLALAALARAELLATGLALLAWAAWRRRAAWRAAALGFLGLVGPYLLAVSAWQGRPALSARDWEARAFPWLAVMPRQWILGWIGVGTAGGPVREALVHADLATTAPPLDPREAIAWLAWALPAAVPAWLAGLAALGAVLLARARRLEPLGGSVALAGPALVVAILPQARDPVLPGNNLLPVLLVLLPPAAAGLVWAWPGRSRRGMARAWRVAACWLGAAALAGAWAARGAGAPPATEGAPPPAPARAGEPLRGVARWIATHLPPDARLAASMESAPAVVRAGRRRVPLPPHWEVPAWLGGEAPPGWVVESSLDHPTMAPTFAELRRHARLVPVLRVTVPDEEGTGWAVVHRLEVR